MSRIDWPPDALPCEVEPLLKPGDYTRHPKGSFWMLRAPNGQLGTITPPMHSVEEHEDGTITVRPSLDYTGLPQEQAMMWFYGIRRGNWHGWLTRGKWVSALGDAS